jgi:adenylate cyclase
MAEDQAKRKLAAILSADVEGYSRLMADDEEATVRTITSFVNLSEDSKQEYFSDGITNDIITDLSKFRNLFVIASNTVFTYKAKPVKVKDVNRELGVRYVLEGSVQKEKDKVRINAQLIDTSTGHHLWAERYDRNLKDLFVVQDEIVQTIVGTMAVKIEEVERTRAMRKDTESLEAYDYLLRGIGYLRPRTRSGNSEARQMFEKAIQLDPHYASAYVGLGRTYLLQAVYDWTEFPAKVMQQAQDLAQKALGLEESNADPHAFLGSVNIHMPRYDLAIRELKRAIELNSNDANNLYYYTWQVLNVSSKHVWVVDDLGLVLMFTFLAVKAMHPYLWIEFHLLPAGRCFQDKRSSAKTISGLHDLSRPTPNRLLIQAI